MRSLHTFCIALLLLLFCVPFTLGAQVSVSTDVTISASVLDSSGGGGSGGGGGGSGLGGGIFGGYDPNALTGVTFSGRAYPMSSVIILRDGQQIVQTIAGPDARFSVDIRNMNPGTYTFSLLTEDSAGRRSTLFTFPLLITHGIIATISGIFLSPTIDTDKIEVAKGDTLQVFGQASPDSVVLINVNSDTPHFFQVNSDSSGAYLLNLDTSILEMGGHHAKSKAVIQNDMSAFGHLAAFSVGTKSVIKGEDGSGSYVDADLNKDGVVNIVDFSILAYWYHKPFPPAYVDLSKDGVVNIVDFSIMAFYWNG